MHDFTNKRKVLHNRAGSSVYGDVHLSQWGKTFRQVMQQNVTTFPGRLQATKLANHFTFFTKNLDERRVVGWSRNKFLGQEVCLAYLLLSVSCVTNGHRLMLETVKTKP